MAPEIHDQEIYSGVSADLFALGVTLFIMLLHFDPFKNAKLSDPAYSLLSTNPRNYWNSVQQIKPELNISEEYMHLVSVMLSVDPT